MKSTKTARKTAATPAPATGGKKMAQDAPAAAAKVLPPQSPVDVPQLPPKPTASTPDEAARDIRRAVDDQTKSNWADGAAPQPRARNARSSIL